MNGIKQGTNSVNKAYLGTNLIMGEGGNEGGNVVEKVGEGFPGSNGIVINLTNDTIIIALTEEGTYEHQITLLPNSTYALQIGRSKSSYFQCDINPNTSEHSNYNFSQIFFSSTGSTNSGTSTTEQSYLFEIDSSFEEIIVAYITSAA